MLCKLLQRTFSVRPCLMRSSLISLCFSAEKIINADLNRLGASGAFLYFGPFLLEAAAMFAAFNALLAAVIPCVFNIIGSVALNSDCNNIKHFKRKLHYE